MANTLEVILSAKDMASKSFETIAGKSESLNRALTKLGLGFLAGFGIKEGVEKIVSLANESVKLYGQEEEANLRLAAAMKHRGVYTQEAYEHNLRFAKQMQDQTTREDDEIVRVQRILTQYGLYGDVLERTTEAVVNFGADEEDLSGSAELVAKSITGGTNALKRYGIDAKGAAGSAERLESILGGINEKFGEDERAKMDGYAGQMKNVTNQINGMKEEIGKLISPMYLKGLESFRDILNSITPFGVKSDKEKIKAAEYYLKMAEFGRSEAMRMGGNTAGYDKDIAKWQDEIMKLTGTGSYGSSGTGSGGGIKPSSFGAEDSSGSQKNPSMFMSEALNEQLQEQIKAQMEAQKIGEESLFISEGLNQQMQEQVKSHIENITKIEEEGLERQKELYQQRVDLQEQEIMTQMDFAARMGAAAASGLGKGSEGFKESAKNMLVTGLGFIEMQLLEANIAAALQALITWNPVPLMRAAAITFAFEGVKAAISGWATGTNFSPGGVFRVGERGTETVYLPRGSSVENNSVTRNTTNNNNPTVVVIQDSGSGLADKLMKMTRNRDIDWKRTLQLAGVTVS